MSKKLAEPRRSFKSIRQSHCIRPSWTEASKGGGLDGPNQTGGVGAKPGHRTAVYVQWQGEDRALGGQIGAGLLLCALESCDVAVEVTDADGFVVYVNSAWRRLFHFEPSGAFGVWWDVMVGDRAAGEELFSSWSQCLTEGHAAGLCTAAGRDGRRRNLLFERVLYLFPGGEAKAIVTTYRPRPAGRSVRVDERSDRLRQTSRRQAEHDMRNLLTMISVSVDALRWMVSEPKVRDRLASVRTAARDGVAVLNALCREIEP